MSDDIKHGNSANHGDYERSDIGVSGVLYFLLGLVVAGLCVHFVVTGLYRFLEKQSETQQTAISPLVTNPTKDTRKLPADYRDYLKQNFPSPQLEIDERNQLDAIRLDEEQTLATYDYIDKNAGTVRIPIDRAMDLIAQRGLPVRSQVSSQASSEAAAPGDAKNKKKEKK